MRAFCHVKGGGPDWACVVLVGAQHQIDGEGKPPVT